MFGVVEGSIPTPLVVVNQLSVVEERFKAIVPFRHEGVDVGGSRQRFILGRPVWNESVQERTDAGREMKTL